EKAKALSVADSVKEEVMDIAAETKADLDRGAPGDKTAVEAIGVEYLKLINLAKTFMFVVLGALALISFFTLMRVGRN
ncbi:MAG: hypothetical protein ACPGVN_09150, partial [Alphaproteobacteria bacterium]